MKIKTLVFWILWVVNSLTLQTVSGQDPDPASPPSLSTEQRTKLDALQTFQALEAAETKPL
jgi:hypothetical protein